LPLSLALSICLSVTFDWCRETCQKRRGYIPRRWQCGGVCMAKASRAPKWLRR
jgi:hypothetical protein